MKHFSLGKEERLLSPLEFRRAMREGESSTTEHFKIFILATQGEKRRLGITTSKKVGTAVRRNRVKRLIREFFRLNKMKLSPSSDILFIAKPGAGLLNYAKLYEELKIIF
jgi:ribonuclease P protein component